MPGLVDAVRATTLGQKLLQLVLRALEILDVDAGPKPSNDVPGRVAQRLGPVQHPPVFALRVADAGL